MNVQYSNRQAPKDAISSSNNITSTRMTNEQGETSVPTFYVSSHYGFKQSHFNDASSFDRENVTGEEAVDKLSKEQKDKKIMADNNGIEEKLIEENDENGQDDLVDDL